MYKKILNYTIYKTGQLAIALKALPHTAIIASLIGASSLVGLSAYVNNYVTENQSGNKLQDVPQVITKTDENFNQAPPTTKDGKKSSKTKPKDQSGTNSSRTNKPLNSSPASTPNPNPHTTSRSQNPSEAPQNTKPPTTTTPPAPSYTNLVNTNFDWMTTSSPVNIAEYKSALGDPNMTAGSSTLARTSVVSVPGRGKVLRQTFPANTYGTSHGIVTFPRLKQTVDEAYIQYDIRFSSGFDWSYGGKLPGLAGVIPGYADGSASGCEDRTAYSWSGRGMWITPGSYPGSSNPSNEWIGYMYNPGKSSPCGDNIQSNKTFKAGSWHTVKQYYKLNSAGSSNGIHTMWFDGIQVQHRTNFVYRTDPNVHINLIYWSMFRGGNTPSWAGSTTDTIDIDNLIVVAP